MCSEVSNFHHQNKTNVSGPCCFGYCDKLPSPERENGLYPLLYLCKLIHLIQRPCYQRGNPCQDPAGNWTTRRSSDDRKETQTAVVWSCFSFIRSGQNHLARHSERGKKTGGQRKRWEDNIREWTGLEFGKSQGQWRTGKNGENWLQHQLWCPNDPRG